MTTIVEQIDKLQQIKNSIYQALIQKNIASEEVSFEQYASAIVLAEKTDTLKYGCSIDCFLPKITSATELVWNEHNGQFVFDNITDIADEALSDLFRKKHHIVINETIFPSLKNISGNNATQYMFYGSKIQSVSFPELKKISGKDACTYMFGDCKNLSSVLLPKLEEISNNVSSLAQCANNMFYGCTQLQTIDLSSLIKCSGSYVIANMFRYCTKLTSVKLDNLQEISGNRAASGMFDNCASLTTISFPSLTNIGNASVFYDAFENCTSLTEIHFRYDMRSVVESLTGYDTQFGAENATIYFDLACAELEVTPTPADATVTFYDENGTEIPNPTVTEVNKYAWVIGSDVFYTDKEIPSIGDAVYDSEGNLMAQTVTSINGTTITIG